jgi:hypothetical protein
MGGKPSETGSARVKIEKFFNIVAQEGDNLGSVADAEEVALRDLTTDLCFEMASVFTVWRPTSLDAIRRMMLREGVGKGLDIKGKSAKKGILSVFVPFMQIHEEKHKSMVQTLPKGLRMRIFYGTPQARETAASNMRLVPSDMGNGQKEAMNVLDDPNYSISSISPELALVRSMEWDLADARVVPIDDYKPLVSKCVCVSFGKHASCDKILHVHQDRNTKRVVPRSQPFKT